MEANEFSQTIVLSVLRVDMRGIGRSCRVRYNHDSYQTWSALDMPQFDKRDEHVESNVTYLGYGTNLPSRQPIFPPGGSNLTTVPDNIVK